MARPIWSGVITFGLVTVPVQLFAAVQDHTLHFHQLERGTSDRVRNRRVNERTGRQVDHQDIVKGYDLGDGEYIVVEPGELDEIAPGKSQVIEVSGFVDLEDVEPAFFDRTYYLAPRSEEYGKVYRLLRSALAETGKAGVATFVMHAREYLVALRAQDEVLELHTLHWADEVRDPRRELPRLPEREAVPGKELRSAKQLIDAMAIDWRPEDYEDTYATKVHELVEAKREGKEIVTEEEPPGATDVVDLEEALRRSLDQAGTGRTSRGGGPASRGSGRRTGSGRTGAPKAGGRGSGGKARSPKAAAGKGATRGRGVRSELESMSRQELYERAGELEIPGRSKMNRSELIEAVADGQRTAAKAAS
ncbi:Ku protein [Streptomyces ovatisporus]|uniref:Non-homologous end joining protein Ku n=1 Tax=Streptomyces ovatisporus TaxID=1128682 RepID=A0ABV9A1B4_9ACTN